jgi:hypothetical protein
MRRKILPFLREVTVVKLPPKARVLV